MVQFVQLQNPGDNFVQKAATFIYYSLLLNNHSFILKDDTQEHYKNNIVPTENY